MTRRLLGPIGGPIAFFLIAGLVFAGLGWVTVAALRVEEAQRESARRADREKELRIVLVRLDARMLPALGVEDTRPFHEYKTFAPDDPITVYGPASAPLLASDLPDWMSLHFQLDPEASWESPQVMNRSTLTALRRYWPEFPLRNATTARKDVLASTASKFPPRVASEAFAARERALPHVSPSNRPFAVNAGAMLDDSADLWDDVKKAAPKEEPKTTPVALPAAKAENGIEAFIPPAAGNSSQALNFPEMPKNPATEKESIRETPPPSAPEPRPTSSQETLKRSENIFLGRSGEEKRSDYDDRQLLGQKAVGDVARYQPQYVLPKLQSSHGGALSQSNSAKPSGSAKQSETVDRFGKGTLRDLEESERKLREMPSAARVPSDAGGFFRLIQDEKTRERERQQLDNLHQGALKKAEPSKPDAKRLKDEKSGVQRDPNADKDFARGYVPAPGLPGGPVAGGPPPASGLGSPAGGSVPGGGGAPPGSGSGGALPGAGPGGPRPMIVAPVAPAPAPPAEPKPKGALSALPGADGFGLLRGSGLGGGGFGGGLGGGTPPVRRIDPTPDPAPAAELDPVPLPAAAFDEPVAPPVAVHLGSLHPQWLTAADGTQLLVLVRTARVENRKTLYQGVVLDWEKLQALLKEEIQDVFPDARLEPVKDPGAASREQSMSALPVRLDPGAEPELPPAGWTPLRIGLVIAWIAAVIAFAAVGLSGWSLVDLAERRIRFVSAVTHELRTPLTSLRLYLDLLLSGMVQDEEKRREYLSTLNVESDRLHRLIDNVLDFAKLERSRKGRELQRVSAADLVDTARQTWTDRVAADGKELIVASSLPEDLDIQTDAALVQQIVGNLIDNARKYTREAADARIWLWARTEDNARVVFEVEDRGPGVEPREQKTIFKPFRRGETADTKAGGAGLGLALSKEWAEVLGGRLTYRTPEGETGSVFRLELPLK